MKIISQKKVAVVESQGFYICEELRCYVIKDTKTRLILGQYKTEDRTRQIFDEMALNFIRPNKEYYSMPQE